MRYLKNFTIAIISLIIILFLIFAAYVVYLEATKYTPASVENLKITNENSQSVPIDKELSILTYNIGFAAYTADFSFFFDGGKYAKAFSKKTATNALLQNANLINKLNLDFIFLQEVDKNTPRGANIEQVQFLQKSIIYPYSYNFALNHSVAFMAVPLMDMTGRVESGLLSGSKFKVQEAVRVNLPAQTNWPMSLAFEQPALLVQRIPTQNNKELILINSHLSAYDSGGAAKKNQLALVEKILNEEYAKGNYVIIGGDWNHIYPEITADYFSKAYDIKVADFYYPFPTDVFKPKNFRFVGDFSSPSNRSASEPYVKNRTYTSVLDWFMVSDNITTDLIKVQNLEFAYSDHQPVLLKFKLKP